MPKELYLDDGEYLENHIDDDRLEGCLSDFHYEEDRWVVVEREENDFIALVDEENVHQTLVYENEEQLERAVVEGDDLRGRYPATDLNEGVMIYDRNEGSALMKSTDSMSLDDMM